MQLQEQVRTKGGGASERKVSGFDNVLLHIVGVFAKNNGTGTAEALSEYRANRFSVRFRHAGESYHWQITEATDAGELAQLYVLLVVLLGLEMRYCLEERGPFSDRSPLHTLQELAMPACAALGLDAEKLWPERLQVNRRLPYALQYVFGLELPKNCTYDPVDITTAWCMAKSDGTPFSEVLAML